MGEESAPECINVYEVRSMWPQTFRLGMALLQVQDEGVQMRMRGATEAVVERQDMPTCKTAETWHDQCTVPHQEHGVAPETTLETHAQHCSSTEQQL